MLARFIRFKLFKFHCVLIKNFKNHMEKIDPLNFNAKTLIKFIQIYNHLLKISYGGNKVGIDE